MLSNALSYGVLIFWFSYRGSQENIRLKNQLKNSSNSFEKEDTSIVKDLFSEIKALKSELKDLKSKESTSNQHLLDVDNKLEVLDKDKILSFKIDDSFFSKNAN